MILPEGKRLVLFDGYCHMCSRLVQIILKFDRKEVFLFAPLTSATGIFWKERCRIPGSIDSIVLVDRDGCYVKSAAVLKIINLLGGLFVLFNILKILPAKWRDIIYDFIAGKRFRWFGRRESCMLPTEGQRKRFV